MSFTDGQLALREAIRGLLDRQLGRAGAAGGWSQSAREIVVAPATTSLQDHGPPRDDRALWSRLCEIGWEHAAHRYFKRAHGAAQLFGQPSGHLARIATALLGDPGGCT